jgi:hypothetical protein
MIMRYFLTTVLMILPLLTNAQNNYHEQSAFISGGVGIVRLPSSEEFSSRTLPNILFVGGFGIPIYKQLYFYNRISYSSKSDYNANDQIDLYNSPFEATASLSQLIYNGGLEYSIFLSEDWLLGFSSGFTYSLVNHKTLLNGEIIQKLDDKSFYGFFTGINLEHKFSDSNFSLMGEALYNYIGTHNFYYRNKLSGISFTFGGRYYFKR